MVRCTYFYETPLGFSFGDVVAGSREEADREFWSRHHRDTCSVISVSVAREPEGAERAEDRADGRGERPGGGAREELGPVPAAPGEGPEGDWHVNLPLRADPVDDDPGLLLVNKRVERDVLLFAGEGDEVKVTKLAKHCYLVRGARDVLSLHPGDEVSALARVSPDPKEEGEQVCGDGLHGGPPSDDATCADRITCDGGGGATGDRMTLDDAVELLRVVSEGICRLGPCGVEFEGSLLAGRDGTGVCLRFGGLDDATVDLIAGAGFDPFPVREVAVFSRGRLASADGGRRDG